MILFLNLYVIIQIFFVNAYPVDVLYIYIHIKLLINHFFISLYIHSTYPPIIMISHHSDI